MEETSTSGTLYGKLPTEGMLIESNDTLAEKDAIIEELGKTVENVLRERDDARNSADDWRDRYNEKFSQFNNLQNALQRVLSELVQGQDIGKSQAQHIAEACNIEMTHQARFSGTVNFDAVVEISIFEDFDPYELNVDSFDLSYNGEPVYDVSSDIYDVNEDSY